MIIFCHSMDKYKCKRNGIGTSTPGTDHKKIGGLECVDHSAASVAPFLFLKEFWIRTQRAAVASRHATNLATHLPFLYFFTFSGGLECVGHSFAYVAHFMSGFEPRELL
jgi:hypothetical protein